MLNYLITVTENTTLTAILVGLIYAYTARELSARGKRILNIGLIAGLAAAAAVAVLKNATKVIDNTGGTGMWNMRIFIVSLAALIVFYILNIRALRRRMAANGEAIISVVISVLIFTLVFYAMPDVFAYPFTFSLNGESVFSTAFFYRLIGYILGVILMLLICLSVGRVAKRAEFGKTTLLLNIVLGVNGFQQLTKIIQVLHAKRVVSGQFLFNLVRFTSNYNDLFIYAAMLIVFTAGVALWIKSITANEPYNNPAEHRKIKAKWRSIRRWIVVMVLCFAEVTLNLTCFTVLNNKEVELSPAEEFEQHGDNLYIPLTQVEDGHLHRFAYTTDDNIEVRFIVIKKPNSSSYGVGLDACDICGETGYYERKGQIVCKLCDVVMNINTIGFKGGCNPIVIDYSVENGYIIVPTYTLVEHQDEFK